MKILLLSMTLISTQALAHADRDWSEDYLAFLSIEYELPISYEKANKSKAQEKPQLDMNFFKEKLLAFSSTPDRKSDQHLEFARNFLKAEYEKLGFEVSFQPFGRGMNFIAEKKGTTSPEKVLILSSHIDTVSCTGANDNGTGTIGLLTLAKELSQKSFSNTVRVLGFDKEEKGLVGSDAYVASLTDKQNIIGNINFEMMGHNSRKDGGFHVIDCRKESSLFLTEAMKDSIATHNLPLTLVKACTDRSDHASFWRHNLPAIVISENFFGGDGDPCYHAKCDIVDERLDYSYMENILSATLATTESLLRI